MAAAENKDLGVAAGAAPIDPVAEARPAITAGQWVVSRDGVAIATTAPIGGNIICEAPECFQDSMENWRGNARLISAAPDLFDALVTLLDGHTTPGTFRMEQASISKARAAIAKATLNKAPS